MAWASKQHVGGVTGKAILLAIEASVTGAANPQSILDLREISECGPRSFRDHINRLSSDGIITITRSNRRVIIETPLGSVSLSAHDGDQRAKRWQKIRRAVFAEKGQSCFYCGAPACHIDHVHPKSRGGTDDLSNLVPACVTCNISKGAKTIKEWRN